VEGAISLVGKPAWGRSAEPSPVGPRVWEAAPLTEQA